MCLNSITNNLQKVKPEFKALDFKDLIKNELPRVRMYRDNQSEFARLQRHYWDCQRTVIESLAERNNCDSTIKESLSEMKDIVDLMGRLVASEQEVA